MRFFYTILCLLLGLQAAGQVAKTDTVYRYFDADWKKTDKSHAAYYDKYWYDGKLWQLRGYYTSGSLRAYEAYSDDSLSTLQGMSRRWYTDGQLSDSSHYVNGKLDGYGVWYYNNGQKSEEGRYSTGEPASVKLWTKDGKPDPNGRPGVVAASFVAAEDGKSVERYIASAVKYPKKAHRHNQEGKTRVGFVVDKDGFVRTVWMKVSSGVEELDNEALRVVRGMPRWKPATSHNRPIECWFELPITFRLD